MKQRLPAWQDRTRRGLLFVAAALALLLLGLDRYAAIAHRPDADSTRAAIYTTAWCPYCARLRTSLDASAISYRDYDVEHSLQGQLGFWTLRGRGVPVSVIGPDVVFGYDVPELTQSLAKLGHRFEPSQAPGGSVNEHAGSSIPGKGR